MSSSVVTYTPTLVPLPWDSEQFGFAAARLDHLQSETAESIAALVVAARKQHIRHLCARIPVDDMATIHALEAAGFQLLDGIQTFEMELPAVLSEPPANVRLFQPSDLEAVLELARTAYVHDRFHADSALSREQADRVHETWMRNSCIGGAADAVIVAVHPDTGDPSAYVTCELGGSIGIIVLVATSRIARGLGLARAVTLGALSYFKQQRCNRVRVGTQLRNIPASRLYEACGFQLLSVRLTYRKLL